MSSQTTSSSGGVGFVGLLTILFIGLKLGNVITWPWFWVLSPTLIPLALLLILLLVLGVVVFIKEKKK